MAERKFYRKIFKRDSKLKKWLKFFGLCFLIGLALVSFILVSYLKDLPRPEKFTEKQTAESAKIYARDDQTLLYEIYGEEKRTVVPLEQISDYLKNAIIASEDAGFYSHHGISLRGIVRAIFTDLRLFAPSQGASTISQQLVRSSYLSLEKTGERKFKEIVLTLELERRYSKDEILGFYLNQIPFGQNAYGVEASSQTYFQKSARDLSLAEAALLTALIKAPSRLSPYGPNQTELMEKKDYVLTRMSELNFITEEQENAAKQEVLKFAKINQIIRAPHFTVWVKGLLEDKYGEDFLKEKGVKISTSLDWDLQQYVEKVVIERAKQNQLYLCSNAAVVVIDPKTGEILALAGSKDFFADPYPENCQPGKNCLFEPQFNVALAGRQPGSAFKPIVYATAFEKGFDDKVIVIDERTNFGVWGGQDYIPQNYDGLFRGPVTIRQALAQSLNIPAIKVLMNLAGIEDSIQTAQSLGITTLNPPFGPSIVLGGYEIKLLELTSVYSAFANNGSWLKPVSVLKIEDNQGNIIENNKSAPKRVLSIKNAALVNNILSDNVARSPMFGARSALFFEGYDVAAKTGTTQSYRDGWTIGYTPFAVVGVWTGNNDNTPMRKEPGIVFAGPIFHDIMQKILAETSPESFLDPNSI